MVQITIDVPEALAERLTAVHERLPEVLAHGLEALSPLPNEVYRALLDFVTNNPSPEAVLHFRPTPQMQERISTLLAKNHAAQLTPAEAAELDEYEGKKSGNRYVILCRSSSVQSSWPADCSC